MKLNDLKSICENLIDTFNIAGKESIDLYNNDLKIETKKDNSPVSNGDLKVNELITNKIQKLTPKIPIVSEETVDLNIKNKAKIFWLIDPIDGTKEYIAGKDEYTLNAALVINTVPVLGLVGVPKKNRLFYSYGPGQSYLIVKMASSYKFCVIATGEFDIYAAKERANEWDYAAGHAVAQNAGAIIKTLDEKPFLYGKEDYKNPSLLLRRSENLSV